MTKPYGVWVAGPYMRDDYTVECETFEEACAWAIAYTGPGWLRIIGDGAEGGYGDDGSGWWDGLTDEERERAEELDL